MPFCTALEPVSLVEHFLDHPPEGFTADRSASGMPTFHTRFDILTTADEALRQRITSLPLYRLWGRLLHWRVRFVGCTVAEYAPVPVRPAADDLVTELLATYGRECPLLIVKDLAVDSPLLNTSANAKTGAFAAALAARGFVILEGMPLAWVPIDFDSVDEYIARLSSSRRKDVRRKLKARDRVQVEAWATGSAYFDDDAAIDECYALYRNVHAQSEIHFDLLSKAFFTAVLRDANSNGVVFMYRGADGLIGWNLCYEYGGMLIDKYIGFAYPQAREHNLYAVSWMHNLEYARQHGLSHYVAGWTDPEVKSRLGARLSYTRHAVYLRNPVLRMLLRRFARHFEGEPVANGRVGVCA
ncbi:GNAT family N-acetyltransferase [Luteibacter sp. SG786]|uniref:peptidogalycan biosysnthesis protein n=1 Tax=Luteibacter sp. SG786 TaxID=2587130 RepID=UPI001421CC87|nr:GNAT family N-acetyltransferase [Luteibacter sp. SG786]NII55418.1 hypothetical protein [Luteibacter sp. SG786]